MITEGLNSPDIIEKTEMALMAGANAIQLREKGIDTRRLLALAYKMREATNKFDSMFFVNDRVDIAMAVGADGVHLGSSSIPVSAVRNIIGAGMLIGASAHGIEEAIEVERQGADFITLGPVFETPSKMKYGPSIGIEKIREASGKINIPIFAIGGIKPHNAADAMSCGAYGVALISGVFGSEDIGSAVKNYLRILI